MTFQLHAITTGTLGLAQASSIAAAIHSFVDYIHIREKQRSARELLYWVEAFRKAGVPAEKIIVNDRLDVALAAGAGGVQLTESSVPLKQVRPFLRQLAAGCSVHEPAAVAHANEGRADWILFGHIYDTASKPGRKPSGLETLQAAAYASRVPVIAIGGIKPHHIREVKAAGAKGVAVMSGIFASKDPAAAAASYQTAIKKEEINDMHIVVNGKSTPISLQELTIEELLASYSLQGKAVIVEINGHIVPKERLGLTTIHEGDRIEIVQFVGGG
ncbi:sulfur carrier protein ThiS [Pseudobacillus badius]|uniref:sulfur carrier protein ThiS n=1 Tax=Bacillus badius TaxID=1455 RepID=UPI003CF113C8